MIDIFISYKSSDRERIQTLVKALEQKGWSVWWDRIIPPGRTFDEVIEEAIDATTVSDLVSRIVYSARASDVRHVVVDGKVVVQGGRLRTAKVEEIRREANRWVGRLRKTIGL